MVLSTETTVAFLMMYLLPIMKVLLRQFLIFLEYEDFILNTAHICVSLPRPQASRRDIDAHSPSLLRGHESLFSCRQRSWLPSTSTNAARWFLQETRDERR